MEIDITKLYFDDEFKKMISDLATDDEKETLSNFENKIEELKNENNSNIGELIKICNDAKSVYKAIGKRIKRKKLIGKGKYKRAIAKIINTLNSDIQILSEIRKSKTFDSKKIASICVSVGFILSLTGATIRNMDNIELINKSANGSSCVICYIDEKPVKGGSNGQGDFEFDSPADEMLAKTGKKIDVYPGNIPLTFYLGECNNVEEIVLHNFEGLYPTEISALKNHKNVKITLTFKDFETYSAHKKDIEELLEFSNVVKVESGFVTPISDEYRKYISSYYQYKHPNFEIDSNGLFSEEDFTKIDTELDKILSSVDIKETDELADKYSKIALALTQYLDYDPIVANGLTGSSSLQENQITANKRSAYYNKNTITSVLSNKYYPEETAKKVGVCINFASFFEVLCWKVGVPCGKVIGYGFPLSHAWNIIENNAEIDLTALDNYEKEMRILEDKTMDKLYSEIHNIIKTNLENNEQIYVDEYLYHKRIDLKNDEESNISRDNKAFQIMKLFIEQNPELIFQLGIGVIFPLIYLLESSNNKRKFKTLLPLCGVEDPKTLKILYTSFVYFKNNSIKEQSVINLALSTILKNKQIKLDKETIIKISFIYYITLNTELDKALENEEKSSLRQ